MAASYPNGEESLNISKETTSKELIEIEGVSEELRREQGINMSAVNMNALEIAHDLFGMPTPDEMLFAFIQDVGLPDSKKTEIAA